MIIYSKIYGGLGNQMFQYAIGKSISIKNNIEFKIDSTRMKNYGLRDFVLNKFNISAAEATNEEIGKFRINKYFDWIAKKSFQMGLNLNDKFYEKNEFLYDENVFLNNSIYLQGYWQSYRYFESIRGILLKEFSLSKPFEISNKLILNKIKDCNSVSLHIRRGDYVNNPKNNSLYNVVGLDYYHRAIMYFNENVKNAHFFVFSDDLDWAAENLSIGNSTYVNINSIDTPECDLILMKHCNHNIIANSTFSWWGAWLNESVNKIVIAPSNWMSNVSDTSELIPAEWIRF
jgi:hypothetical protein